MNIHRDHTDQQLLEAYRSSHKREWMGELFSRYTALVYGLCLKYLKDRDRAQDAVMNIFERLIEKLKNEEVVHFKSWLYMVAKNHCLMELRKKSPEVSHDFMEFSIGEHPIDEPMHVEDDLEALNDCLKTLKTEQEQCVKLFYLEKLSYQEVSDKAGYDLKAVKSFIQNGKRNLKICLEEKNVRR